MAIYGDITWQARHQLHKQSVKASYWKRHPSSSGTRNQLVLQNIQQTTNTTCLNTHQQTTNTMSQHPPAPLITNCHVYFLLFLVNLYVVEMIFFFRVKWFKNNRHATVNFVAACSSSAAFKKHLFADILITYISYYFIVYTVYIVAFLYLVIWK